VLDEPLFWDKPGVKVEEPLGGSRAELVLRKLDPIARALSYPPPPKGGQLLEPSSDLDPLLRWPADRHALRVIAVDEGCDTQLAMNLPIFLQT